jgi:hypothetical protein
VAGMGCSSSGPDASISAGEAAGRGGSASSQETAGGPATAAGSDIPDAAGVDVSSSASDAGASSITEGSTSAPVHAARPSNFVCSQVLGLLTSNEWYSQGFEKDGVDPDKWQIKYQHYGYVREWANPDSTFWSAPINSPCKTSSTTPDRVVFAALDWEMLTEDDWAAALEQAVDTIKLKYPTLRWLDIMTLIRCPNNVMCNPNAKYGPGANMSAAVQDCWVPAYEDAAIARVAAAHPDFVGVGPKIEASACRMPVDGAHLSADSNGKAAQDIANYYKNLP